MCWNTSGPNLVITRGNSVLLSLLFPSLHDCHEGKILHVSAWDPLAACELPDTHQKGVHFRHWSSEVYGLGKAYRKALGLGVDAYLPFTSDHGITSCNGGFELHEVLSPVHVTFQRHRAQYRLLAPRRRLMAFRCPRQLIAVEHPYISYFAEQAWRSPQRARGTLIFVPHSVPKEKHYNVNISAFMDAVQRVPATAHPVRLMVHFHDVDRGILELLEPFGFPVLSAGNPRHIDFIDRLREAITEHATVASNEIRTEAFLARLLGKKFVVLSEYGIESKHQHHWKAFASQDGDEIDSAVKDHLLIGQGFTDLVNFMRSRS